MGNITVEEWNEEIAINLTWNIVILSVYLIIGICGNAIVVAVYTFQMNKMAEERYFIPVIAVFDLIATLVCASFGIFQDLNYVNFSNKALCQTAQFFDALAAFTPILLLLIIAFQRYIKLCKPLKPPMTPSLKRGMIFLAFSVSFLVALPIPFVYGIVPHKNIKHEITGKRCGKLKDGHELVRVAYGSVLGLFAVAIVTILIILYSKIGRTIYKQLDGNNRKLNKTKNTSVSDSNYIDESSTYSVGDIQMTQITGAESGTGKISVIESKHQTAGDIHTISSNSSNANVDVARFNPSRNRQKTNRAITNKLTMIFLIITVLFLLSYFPKVVLLVIEGIYPDFWERISDSQRPGVMFISQMYIINNIVNPFIYAFLDFKFRQETKIFLKRICPCVQ